MIEAWFNYQYSNLLGFIVFASIAWLAIKSDLFKDFLALCLVALLLVPVPFVMTIHFSNSNWISFIFCGVIQIGLGYLCYIFLKYMISYHKNNKYTFWE